MAAYINYTKQTAYRKDKCNVIEYTIVLVSESRLAVVIHEAKKKQHVCASSVLHARYSELYEVYTAYINQINVGTIERVVVGY